MRTNCDISSTKIRNARLRRAHKQNCENLRTLEKLFSPDAFELHSPSEVSDQATCLFCDQQEFDSGAERSVRLKRCYGRCEN